MKKELIRLGTQKPALRPHIRPILAALAGRTALAGRGAGTSRHAGSRRVSAEAFWIRRDRFWQMVVRDTLEEVCHKELGKHFYDEGLSTEVEGNAEATTGVVETYIDALSENPPRLLKDDFMKVEEAAQKYAAETWMEENPDLMEEYELSGDDVNYYSLHELGLSRDAESLSEMESDFKFNHGSLLANFVVELFEGDDETMKVRVTGEWRGRGDAFGGYGHPGKLLGGTSTVDFVAPRDLSESAVRARVEKMLHKAIAKVAMELTR